MACVDLTEWWCLSREQRRLGSLWASAPFSGQMGGWEGLGSASEAPLEAWGAGRAVGRLPALPTFWNLELLLALGLSFLQRERGSGASPRDSLGQGDGLCWEPGKWGAGAN